MRRVLHKRCKQSLRNPTGREINPGWFHGRVYLGRAWKEGQDINRPLLQSSPQCLLLLFSCSVVSNSVTPWTATLQASLSLTIPQSLLKLMSTESMMPSNHLILCSPLLLRTIQYGLEWLENHTFRILELGLLGQ